MTLCTNSGYSAHSYFPPNTMEKQANAHVKASLEAPAIANLNAQLQTLQLGTRNYMDIYMMYYRIEYEKIYKELYKKYSQ